MSPPIKVGIVGYGSSANIFHLPYILPNPDLQVHAFLQRAEAPQGQVEPSKHCTVEYPQAKHYRTAEDFFADSDIELVIVCTGHSTHATFAEQALLAGKHVVVEKPFTITSAEADHLIATSKETNKILTCFQNRRYDSDFLTLQHLTSQNSFGKITEFENHYSVDNPPWIHNSKNSTAQPGDGLLYGLGSHSIDQTLLLFGLPNKITAFTRSLLVSNGADDSFTIILQYAGSDLLVTIKTTVVVPLPPHKILKYRVLGTEGTFHKYGEDVQVEQFFEGVHVKDAEKFGVEPDRCHGYLSTRATDGSRFDGVVKSQRGRYTDYYRDVVAAIRGQKEVVVKPEEARNVIRLIELARESAEKGVMVDWSDGR
ncbi:Putative gfo/Idh/MocA-like oxidoreductase, NAD(P)-binding domain superfamily [Septoria linicola]|uniref:Gfo/Idh/MocA-like oxidoreductase, NAD(P)-binding domain superfamily n=1 Tax=Septoria linicola TaxID=215465 RepID=A0A9Q9ARH4_9PEZI|nr:Putative gfo/Idh/MocA-like oxidoreductase, NAD(P)-binding domain superfamily [Septoria linicola]